MKKKWVKVLCITLSLATAAPVTVFAKPISQNENDILAVQQSEFESLITEIQTILDKGIMPSEKVLDFPVDCNTLTGSVNVSLILGKISAESACVYIFHQPKIPAELKNLKRK